MKTKDRRQALKAYLSEVGPLLYGVSRADALACIARCSPAWAESLSEAELASLGASLSHDLDAVGERMTEPGETPIRWRARREGDPPRRPVRRRNRLEDA